MKKIMIIGKNSQCMEDAPLLDPEWEKWCINKVCYNYVPDKIFDMHKATLSIPDAVQYLRQFGNKAIISDRCSGLPEAEIYPLVPVLKELGLYFTSSLAWILGYLLYTYKGNWNELVLGIYGVDLVDGSEYFDQKACVEYYVGIIRGRGAKVQVSVDSNIGRADKLYGVGKEVFDLAPLLGL